MGKSCVTEISELMCSTGGKITILKHGQQSEAGKSNVMNANSQEQQIYNPLVQHLKFSFLFLLLIFSCKNQDKEQNIITSNSNLIGKELKIDKYDFTDDKFRSKILDQLFSKKNYTYLIGEYSGTSKEDFYCKIIGLFKDNQYQKSYVLFFDPQNILRDTLDIQDKDISLNILFEQNKKGIAVGKMDTTDIFNSYFQISDIFEVVTKPVKLQRLPIKTKILECELPIEYLSEEYVGIEHYFHFGTENKPKVELTCEEILIRIIKSSNSNTVQNFPKFKLRIENIAHDKIIIQLYSGELSDRTGKEKMVENTVAWLEFYPESKKLLDITNDRENPDELQYSESILKNIDIKKLCL